MENVVGRLVEARLTKSDAEEVRECLSEIAGAVARMRVPVVGIFDASRLRVLSREEADLLLDVMRNDNERVLRTAIVIDGDALFEMQIERLVRAAALPNRQVFRLAGHALHWLSEILTATELARARAFLARDDRG